MTPRRLYDRNTFSVAVVTIVALSSFSRLATLASSPPGPLALIESPSVALDPEINLWAEPNRLFTSGEWVTVSWTGIEGWMFPDAFVAAFSPGTVLDDPSTLAENASPIKYQYIVNAAQIRDEAMGSDDRKADIEVQRKRFTEALTGVKNDEEEAARNNELDGGVTRSADYVGDAPSSLRFRLLNMRDNEGYRFGLFKGGPSNPVLVAKTDEPVTFVQEHEVLHTHIALADDHASIRVSWVTGPASISPAVRYAAVSSGRNEVSQSWQIVPANTLTYGRDDMCGEPATTKGFHNPGMLHSAVLTGLEPGKAYEYQAGDQQVGHWGASSFFSAPPSSGSSQDDRNGAAMGGEGDRHRSRDGGLSMDESWGEDAVTIGVFGDMGTAESDGSFDAGHDAEPPSLKTVAILKQLLGVGTDTEADEMRAAEEDTLSQEMGIRPRLGLVMHIGDLSYARGYDAQWDEYLDLISPVASRVPWMVAVGNHERDAPTTSTSGSRPALSYFTGTDSGGDCGIPTAYRFLMPGAAGKPLKDTPWYGFDYGPVHFTVMSTEHDFTPGSEQHMFLEEDLASVDRSSTPWLIFAGHRPMYVSSEGPGASDCDPDDPEEHCSNDQPVAHLMQSSLEPLLVQYKVDLALYGHHHSYQRSCKVEGGVCKGLSSSSPMQLDDIVDEYIAPIHIVMGMAGMGLSQNMADIRPSWLEYANDREFGLGVIVADSSSLRLSFILDSDEQVADEIWLRRSSSKASDSTWAVGADDEARADQQLPLSANDQRGKKSITLRRRSTLLRSKLML